jgi:hypothetical protein
MPKNSPPPACPKCRKPMHFILVKTGGRKFRCIDCVAPDPLQPPEVTKPSEPYGRLSNAASVGGLFQAARVAHALALIDRCMTARKTYPHQPAS